MLPQGYVQNITKSRDYATQINASSLPTARGIAINDDDRMRRAIIEQLMCYLTVDIEQIAARYGLAPPTTEALEPMMRNGLLHIHGGRIAIRPEGRLAMRAICAAFDTYLTPQKERHSSAL